MKSLRILLNSFIFAGLAFGAAGSAFASKAPAVQLKPGKGVLSYLGDGLWYALAHPKLTLSVAAGATLYYLNYCRATSRDLPKETKKQILAETINLSLTSRSEEVDKTWFRNWNLRFGSALELVANPRLTYLNLWDAFHKSQSDEEFCNTVLRKITEEKTIIKALLMKLDRQFQECNLLPRINDYDPSTDNPVRSAINRYKTRNKCDYIYQLPKEQFILLDKEINALSSFSLGSLFNVRPWKTFNWHRLYALPQESYAIEQFWKLYQMLTHLDALEFCINNKDRSIAPWNTDAAKASYSLPTI